MNLIELSKEVSYALRHSPWEYELEIDEQGWVKVDQLLVALRNAERWKNIKLSDLYIMIDKSDKKRFEISEGRIRALYGHSLPLKIYKEMMEPPIVLYHGTTDAIFLQIKKTGLLPMSRQFVHLSIDVETAVQVGKRRDKNPIILVIDALSAWNDGVAFYYGNEKVWLADSIPARYIKLGTP